MIAPVRQLRGDPPEILALLDVVRRTGSKKARNELIERYMPLVWKIAGNHRAKAFMAVDELFSYGVDGLMAAIERWRFEKGVSFGRFAKDRIRYGILDGLRSMCQSTRTQRERGEALTFSTLHADSSGGSMGVEHRDFDDFETADEFNAVVGRSNLDWLERVVLALSFREGWSAREIGEALSRRPASVSNLIERITAKLGNGEDVPPELPSDVLERRQMREWSKEFNGVLADADKFIGARMHGTAARLFITAWHRSGHRKFQMVVKELRGDITSEAARRGLTIDPSHYEAACEAAINAEEPLTYRVREGRDYRLLSGALKTADRSRSEDDSQLLQATQCQ